MDSTIFEETAVADWTVARLLELSPESLQRLTRKAVGTLAVSRLLLGRCMIALDATNAVSELGYSGGLHFVSLMGVELVEARKARRVARALEELPQLRETDRSLRQMPSKHPRGQAGRARLAGMPGLDRPQWRGALEECRG